MRPFPLPAEQAQELHRLLVSSTEPVRRLRVELGGLTGKQDEVMIAEHEPQPPVQDVDPLVALVRLQLGLPPGRPGREDELVGLDAAGFLTGLGLAATQHPSRLGEHIPADATGRTAVPGVWAAGNVTDLAAQVGASAAAGALAAAHINADLVAEETSRAVAGR